MADDLGDYETPPEGSADESASEQKSELSESLVIWHAKFNQVYEEESVNAKITSPLLNKRKIHDVSPSAGTDCVDTGVAPFQKKRLTEGGSDTSNVEKSLSREGLSSDDYDTDDNMPLSQYGSSTGNDRDPVVTDGRRKAKPNMLRRALHNRARRRVYRTSMNQDTDTDEVPTVSPAKGPFKVKRVKKVGEAGQQASNEWMNILKDIQHRLTNIELDNSASSSKLESIEDDMKKLNKNSIGKENLLDVMNKFAASFKGDLKEQNVKIKQNKEQLTLLTDGLNATNQDLRSVKKDQAAWEEDILKYKVQAEHENVALSKKISELEDTIKEVKAQTEQKNPNSDKDNKNIILEGLNEIQGEDVYDTVIRAIKELKIIIFDNDINLAHRIGNFKSDHSWPRPIRVELVSTHVREVIWENRRLLENSPTHFNVRISRDETKEVRIARALLRKGAQKARNQGKTVYQHPDHILIDGKKIDLSNASQLEESLSHKRETGLKNKKSQDAMQSQGQRSRKLPAERKTKRGLAFFTSESKRSCFYPVKVVYEGVEYKTPEHNYQCIKAMTSEMMELYHDIKNADTPREAKNLGANIPYNPEWERIKPDVMYNIQLRKHEQHPELGDELCEIDGVFMVASRDRYWATGVTIMDRALDSGEYGGRNELGKSLNRVKDTLLSRRSVLMIDKSSPQSLHLAPHKKDLPKAYGSGNEDPESRKETATILYWYPMHRKTVNYHSEETRGIIVL